MRAIPTTPRGDFVDAYTAMTLPVRGQLQCGLDSIVVRGVGRSTNLHIINAVDGHIGARHLDAGYSNLSLPLWLAKPLWCAVCREDIVVAGATSGLHIQESIDGHNREQHTSGAEVIPLHRPPCAPVTALALRRLQRRWNGPQ